MMNDVATRRANRMLWYLGTLLAVMAIWPLAMFAFVGFPAVGYLRHQLQSALGFQGPVDSGSWVVGGWIICALVVASLLTGSVFAWRRNKPSILLIAAVIVLLLDACLGLLIVAEEVTDISQMWQFLRALD